MIRVWAYWSFKLAALIAAFQTLPLSVLFLPKRVIFFALALQAHSRQKRKLANNCGNTWVKA